jgi:UDP-N-acetylenolpyruvoylglucosamine reductase
MMRYDIEETAVYEKVRTVVWEDGAARPLLPDPCRYGYRQSPKNVGTDADVAT